MKESLLHLGSNIGDRFANIEKALKYLSSENIEILSISNYYETEAWGKTDQQSFLNLAIKIRSEYAAEDLLNLVQKIENTMGRRRDLKWGPRIIDIDILFFESEIYDLKHLSIPHPLIEKRNFVLVPLMDIAPDFIHPILKKSIRKLAELSQDKGKLKIWQSNG